MNYVLLKCACGREVKFRQKNVAGGLECPGCHALIEPGREVAKQLHVNRLEASAGSDTLWGRILIILGLLGAPAVSAAFGYPLFLFCTPVLLGIGLALLLFAHLQRIQAALVVLGP